MLVKKKTLLIYQKYQMMNYTMKTSLLIATAIVHEWMINLDERILFADF